MVEMFDWLFKDERKIDYDFDILCADFLEPIIDNGEARRLWIDSFHKRHTKIMLKLSKTYCPLIDQICRKEKCTAYCKGFINTMEYDTPLTEKIMAKLQNRSVKLCYHGYSCLPECRKKVF